MVSLSADNVSYRSTIQSDVDWHLSADNEEQYNFAVMNLEGPCELVRSVNIRFYNDKFMGFKAIKGNNNLYFKKCHFGQYFQLTEGVAMFESCVFATPPVFISCKVDFVGQNEITETVYLKDKTFLKSNENNYTYPEVFFLTKNSRIESFSDIYEGSVLVYQAKENCFIKSVKPSFIGLSGPIFFAEDNCTLHISDTLIEEAGPPLFDMVKSCSLQVFNTEKITVTDRVLKQYDNCKSVFKNIPIIESTNDIYECGNSDLTVLNVDKSNAQNNFFTNTGTGNYSFKFFDLIQANNIGFQTEGGNFRITGKSDALITTVKEVVISSGTNPANVTICLLDKIESTSEACLNYNLTYSNLSQIKSVIGQKQGVIATNKSYIKANQIETLKGNTLEGINISANSTSINSDLQNIIGQTYGFLAATNCHIANKNITNITGSSQDGISIGNNSSAILSTIQTITGSNNGITSSNDSKVVIKNVVTISGSSVGIALTESDLTYTAQGGTISGSTGITATTSSPGKNRIILKGPATINGISNDSCDIQDSNITWSKDSSNTNSIWTSKYTTGQNVSTTGSYLNAAASNFQKISPNNSLISVQKTTFSEITQNNSTIFGAQAAGTLKFTSGDADISASAFLSSYSTVGIQSDTLVLMETAKFDFQAREDFNVYSKGTVTIKSDSSLDINSNSSLTMTSQSSMTITSNSNMDITANINVTVSGNTLLTLKAVSSTLVMSPTSMVLTSGLSPIVLLPSHT